MDKEQPKKKIFRKPENDLKQKRPLTEEGVEEPAPLEEEKTAEVPVAAAAPHPKRHTSRKQIEPSEFIEKVVTIKRVTKVTKGGKKLSFSALVVIGDGKGRVGYNLDKAGEVAAAIKKSLAGAKKNMVQIPLKGSTIPHAIIGSCGAAQVLLKPASEGTGVIASGPVRAICDGAGIRDILTKCHRSNNPINVVKATMDGLRRLKSVANVPLKIETTNATA